MAAISCLHCCELDNIYSFFFGLPDQAGSGKLARRFFSSLPGHVQAIAILAWENVYPSGMSRADERTINVVFTEARLG